MSRVVLVHGFTQTGASWAPVAPQLGGHEVLTPDLSIGDDLWDTADRLGTEAGVATYIGYSMGGRVALHLALQRPELVERLVLVSATAGIDDGDERAARRASDEALADQIETGGVDAFLERWLAQPMFTAVTEPGPRCQDAATLTASLRRCGTGTQQPLWDRLGEIEVPALVIAGERDQKFAELAERLSTGLPRGELAVVPAAGHAVHLERPDAFVAIVQAFLRR